MGLVSEVRAPCLSSVEVRGQHSRRSNSGHVFTKILRALIRHASTPVDSELGNRVKAYTPVYAVKLADCGN